MRRFGLVVVLALGVLVMTIPAAAQAPTVSFGGQMRVFGFAWDNVTDFKDSRAGQFRDSNTFYFQRFRLFTTIESVDKKAKAYWALEIGDITWGTGGGASGAEFRGCTGAAPVVNPTVTVPPPAGAPPGTLPTPATVTSGPVPAGTRVGPGAGGCLGADGVNVETKNLYLEFQVPGVPDTSILLGAANLTFVSPGPFGGFADDDVFQVKVTWKRDPVDVQLVVAKPVEGNRFNADDVDLYMARIGVNVTKDLRLTLEGMVIDERPLPGQSFGDTFWVGGTVATKIGTVNLDGGVVYGRRALGRAATGATCGSATSPCEESGFGAVVAARVPVGPVNLIFAGWYTSGDDQRGPGSASNGTLTQDSDKLPIPIGGASWGNAPFIGEWILGTSIIGAPAVGQTLYLDPSGSFGVGASAQYALTPAVTLGGGIAYIGATDAPHVVSVTGGWGDYVVEVDGGIIYRFNPNLTISGLAGYMSPDRNDSAWAVAFRTQFSF